MFIESPSYNLSNNFIIFKHFNFHKKAMRWAQPGYFLQEELTLSNRFVIFNMDQKIILFIIFSPFGIISMKKSTMMCEKDQAVLWRETMEKNWGYQPSASINYQTWVQPPNWVSCLAETSDIIGERKVILTMSWLNFRPSELVGFGGICYVTIVAATLPITSLLLNPMNTSHDFILLDYLKCLIQMTKLAILKYWFHLVCILLPTVYIHGTWIFLINPYQLPLPICFLKTLS